jgi:hypothetical protein
MPLAEERLQRGPNAPAIRAGEITAENGRVDVAGAPRIPREELAAKLLRRTVLLADATAWNLKLAETIAGRDRPLERAVPITLTPFGALMSRGSQCGGELRLEHGFDGFSDVLTQLGFEVLAETQNRRMVHALRATLLHGVPPSPLISAICLASREVTLFFFFYKSRDGSSLWTKSPDLLTSCSLLPKLLYDSQRTVNTSGAADSPNQEAS